MFSDLKITHYLDIWRGATYSLILSLFIIQVANLDGMLPYSLILTLIVVTFYIVMDGSVRFYSREKIWREIDERHKPLKFFNHNFSPPVFEFSIFFLELLGLVFLAISIKFSKNLSNPPIFLYNKAFWLFLMTVVLYNFLQIGASTNQTIKEYFLITFFKNSIENESVKEHWLKNNISIRSKLIDNIYNINKEVEVLKKKLDYDEKDYNHCFNSLTKAKRKYKFKRSITHLLIQLTSFHLVVLNLIFAILYYTQVYHSNLFNYIKIDYSIYNVNVSIIIVTLLALLSIIFYYLISRSDVILISKLIKNKISTDKIINEIDSKKTKIGSLFQCTGNITYLLLIICIYLLTISFSFTYIYLVVITQQMIVSSVLLYEK